MERIIEVLSIPNSTLDEIAIEETVDGTVLNVDELIDDEDQGDMMYEFYRNVNLTNRW